MYTTKQAAEILNLSIRAIQIKCNKTKVNRIGNEFQITDEHIETWRKVVNNETKANTSSKETARIRRRNTTPRSYYILGGIFALLISSYFAYTQYEIKSAHEKQLQIKDEVIKETQTAKGYILDENKYLKNEILKLQQNNTILKDSINKIFGYRP